MKYVFANRRRLRSMKRAALARGAAGAGGLDVTAIELPAPTPRFQLGLLAAYPILLVAGYVLIPATGGPAPLWPADAVLFLAFLVLPVRRWLLVGLAAAGVELITTQLASHLLFGQSMGIGAVLRYPLAHILTDLGPVMVARGLRAVLQGPRSRLVASPVWLLAVVAGVLPGALLGDWILAKRSGVAVADIDVAVWMLGTTLGIVVFTPALALLLDRRWGEREATPGRRSEAVAIAALIVLIFGWRSFMPSPQLASVPSLMLLMFPLSWLALRFPRRAMYLAAPAIALAVCFVAIHGFGSFRPLPGVAQWQNPILSAQLSLLAILGSAIFISGIQHNQRFLLAALGRDRARLRWYAAELDHTEDAARQRTAEDLHDGISQTLTGQNFLLAALRLRLNEPESLAMLAGAEAASVEARQHVRDLIADLSPGELESTNLRELLESMGQQFEQRYRFPVLADAPADCELPADTLRLVFRIVRELIFNAYQHSHGTRVWVQGHSADDKVIIEVCDDGRGFSHAEARPPAAGHGLGLIQLFERAEAVGGSVRLGSRNGIDSLVTVVLPVHLGEPELPAEERGGP